ncbi:MAG: hypothetical protein ACFBZ9_10910 [Sphingomonadales bacterium]
MAIFHHMTEETIDVEHGSYLFIGFVSASEDEPRFETVYEIRSKDRVELKLEIRFLATNPLGIDDIVIGTATAYGLCIAGKLTRKTAKEAIKCYRDSKKSNPNRSILDHAKEAAGCLAKKSGIMKDTASDALIDCLGVSNDDDDDTDT